MFFNLVGDAHACLLREARIDLHEGGTDMPRYHTRNGIVLTSFCGEYVLAAASALRSTIPGFVQLNETSAFLWRKLETGADEEELETAVNEAFEIDDPQRARAVIEAFLVRMLNTGYLIKDADDLQGDSALVKDGM